MCVHVHVCTCACLPKLIRQVTLERNAVTVVRHQGTCVVYKTTSRGLLKTGAGATLPLYSDFPTYIATISLKRVYRQEYSRSVIAVCIDRLMFMPTCTYPRGPLGRVMVGMEIFRLLVGVDMAVKWLILLNFLCRSASARRKKVAAVLPYGFSWIILDKCVWESKCMCV